MKKKVFTLLLTLLFILPTTLTSFAEVPSSLAAPQNVQARVEDGSIRLRWTVPQSIISSDAYNSILYCIDYKINNGPWHYSGPVNDTTLGQDSNDYFHGFVGNLVMDEQNAQETFFVYFHLGLNSETDLDFVNNTYTFRVRFAYYDYDNTTGEYLTSPFSAETTVGKNTQGVPPTSLAAPTNLKGEVRKHIDGSPYFYLSWSNPASVDAANKNVPIEFKVDFKIGNGTWYSVEHGQDWWGGELYASTIDFDPIQKEYADKIAIEENTYYFRILYAYEPVGGTNVYSPFSNTISIGISAHDWAREELQKAFEEGMVPDIIKGKDLTKPITREEFCELAVTLYEKGVITPNEPVYPDPFYDTDNPRVLKAYALGITNGTKAGTSNIPFEPNTLITREQCAAMLYRTIMKMIPDADNSIIGVKDFPDQKYIDDYAVIPAKYMFKLGIIKGDSNGYFMPKRTPFANSASYGMAAREEAILMAYRIFGVFVK